LNTQAHLVIAAALLCQTSNAEPKSWLFAGDAKQRTWLANMAVLAGALMPDISLYVMFAQARIKGISHNVIWEELYYSALWQNIGAITNSIPVYLTVAMLGFILLARARAFAVVVLVFGLAGFLHCLTDLPLHADDGHAHFWPFSAWVYESPVSYWDSNYFGHYWQPIEFLIFCVASVALWRRFSSIWVRLATFVGLITYPAMLMFWIFVMRQ